MILIVDYTKEIGKVSKYGKITKWAGWVGTAVAVADVEIQYSQGKIDQFQRWTEHTSSTIGAIPVIGTAWTVGWYMGKRYGISTWFCAGLTSLDNFLYKYNCYWLDEGGLGGD